MKHYKLRENNVHSNPQLGRFRPVFNEEFESELIVHVVELQNRFYGIGLQVLRRLAYELAEQNGVQNPFSKKMKLAGKAWAVGFLKRYPKLSLRQPEPTSMSRLSGFNRVQVEKLYALPKAELEIKKFLPHNIYNLDESGITTVQKPGQILAKKGMKQVGRVVSGEKGQTTVVCAMSATGFYVPPMFIFKRKRQTDLLLRDCPAGSVGYPSPNGWIDHNLFLSYIEHFVKFTKPTASNPVLIIMDGHQSHKSLKVIEFARQNFVTLVTIPPHTSHRLQPLDLTFFGPLKKAVWHEMDKWMTSNPGKRITDYDQCSQFTPAYMRVASVEKAMNGFSSAGIWPFNPD